MTAPAEPTSNTERLVRVETKLDTLLLQAPMLHSDHETRIRRLERVVWLASGFASATGGLVGALLSNLV